MSGRPTDVELRAMLEARAGAVSPGAAGEALAGARAAIAGPTARHGAGVAFLPRPVASVRHRSRTPWGIAAVAAAAVIAIAVLGSRVQPDQPSASHPVVGASLGPSSSDRSVLRGDITVDALRSQLSAGELDGKTVVIPGRLYQEDGRRCLAGTECTPLRIDGVPSVAIDRGGRSVDEVQAEIDRFGQSAPVVLRGVDGRLALVGWLTAGAGEPIKVGQLQLGSLSGGSVGLVDGWLIGGMPTFGCPVATMPAPPCPRQDPWLTASQPLPDGTPIYGQSGHTVLVDPEVGLGDAPAELAGPFLVRENEHPENVGIEFDVLARFSPSTTVWVQQPRTDLAGPTIPAADLITALGDGSLDGQLFAIDGELKGVAWECPLDARPCHRFYVDGLPGVAITWDGMIGAVNDSGDATGSTMDGRLLVTPRHGRLQPQTGYLELLGVLHGDLDHPIGVRDLGTLAANGAVPDPLQLEAADGWLAPGEAVFCPLIRPGADVASVCPLSLPLLTESKPAEAPRLTPADGLRVRLDPGAPGIGVGSVPEPGPFLVRQIVVGSACSATPNDASGIVCDGPPVYGWQVAGAYEPGAVRVVTFP